MSDLDIPNAPAGWYSHGGGRQYWDGAHWLGEVQGAEASVETPAAQTVLPPPPPSPIYGYPPPQYPPGFGYSAPPPYGYAQPSRTKYNGFAIASFVLGLVWLYWLGSILALVFGYIARRQIKATGDGGGGLAIAGIVLGWLGVAWFILSLVLVLTSNSGYTSL